MRAVVRYTIIYQAHVLLVHLSSLCEQVLTTSQYTYPVITSVSFACFTTT